MQQHLKQNGMNSLQNKYDAIEQLIYTEQLRIEAIDIHPEMDLMLIVLNTKVVLQQKISTYPILKNATKDDLLQFTLNPQGTGVHWMLLDEDLSLKGFLNDELKKLTKSNTAVAA